MWLAKFVYTVESNQVHSTIGCSTDFDALLHKVLDHNYSDKLTEWQNTFKHTRDFESHIEDMRHDKTNGVNLSFNGNDTFVDFEKIDVY